MKKESVKYFLFLFVFTDYPYLKQLLESDVVCEERREIDIKRKFFEELLKNLDLRVMLPAMYQNEMISSHTMNEILAKENSKGHQIGLMLLLTRMQCHLSPQQWYYKFLHILKDKNYDYIIMAMEPKFLTDEGAFDPDRGMLICTFQIG